MVLQLGGAGEPEWLLEPAPRPATGVLSPALAPGRPSVTSPSEKKSGRGHSPIKGEAGVLIDSFVLLQYHRAAFPHRPFFLCTIEDVS